jgi:hypothetical protein
MASETFIQTFVHKLEEGSWRPWMLRALTVVFILFVVNLWIFRDNGFKGLSHEKAMEQAQVSREIARGNGFSTKMIRPAALYQFRENLGRFNLDRTPDTFHAPLNPILNAPFLAAVKSYWAMSTKDLLYIPDAVLVCVQFFWMMLGWLLSYLTMRRLFDARLAAFGVWLLILCQSFWDYALSGLPQNLMFFLFSGALYCLVRAVQNRIDGIRTWRWLLACAVCFGFLALAHALTLWIFVGAVAFVAIYFRPRLFNVGLLLGTVAIMYTPMLIHNQRACGNPLGLGWYSGLDEIKGSEHAIMRSMEPPFERVSPGHFRNKIQSKIISQSSDLMRYLGGIVVAPVFFLALMHRFRRKDTSDFRWAVLLMWLAALSGMSVYGLDTAPTFMPFAPPAEANDLHLLFIPLFTAYGLAFVLVLWSRLEINVRLVRWGFVSLIFILSGFRFATTFAGLNSSPKASVQWPPYVPPFIAILNQWTTDQEVIASDVPWAVAWYADRKSLWLPMSIQDFTEVYDYNQLSGRLVGMYLTPMSGNRMFVADVMKGDFKDWAPFIQRQLQTPGLKDFPLRAMVALPMNNECIFYADRDRWTARED